MNRRSAIVRCLHLLCAAASPVGAAISISHSRASDDLQPRDRRIALVIGNGEYRFGALKNAMNDAKVMAETLRTLGFDVEYRANAGRHRMLDAIRSFVLRSKDYDVRLFYYAGHGVQVNGKNYLIPVDVEIESETEIPFKSADVSEMVERLGQNTAGMNIVILDACRNNPFADGATVVMDGRLLRFRGLTNHGLAPLDAPTGTLIAFSTAPGAVAIDDPGALHSSYTKHLLAHVTTPGLPVELLFKRVRVAVSQETNRKQVPWESSSLTGDFCFRTADGRCRYQP